MPYLHRCLGSQSKVASRTLQMTVQNSCRGMQKVGATGTTPCCARRSQEALDLDHKKHHSALTFTLQATC